MPTKLMACLVLGAGLLLTACVPQKLDHAPSQSALTKSDLPRPIPAPNQISAELLTLAERAGAELGVSIIVDQTIVDSWNLVSYRLITNTNDLKYYLALLTREYKKYPPGYLSKANTSRIVLGLQLSFEGQNRAAIPDPYERTMYLSIDGAYGVHDDAYLVHVMHHELHHSVDHTLWGEMSEDWPAWLALNPHGFSYGNGGTEAYENTTIDYYSPTYPHPGFINRYSMTGDEEDRAELIAWLLTPGERLDFLKIYSKDAILRAKYDLLRTTLHRFAGKEFLPAKP